MREIHQDLHSTLAGVNPDDEMGNHWNEPTSEVAYLAPSDSAIWSQGGLDVALAFLERIQVSLIRAAELFRETNPSEANRFFAQCVEGLQRFLEAVRNTQSALSIDFTQISNDNVTLAETEKNLLGILKMVFQNQQRKEYEEIADRIEYELLTNLSSWNSALKKLNRLQTDF